MYKAEDYTYRVFWSEEDQEYVGVVAEFPLLSCLEADQFEAFKGIVEVVRFALEIMKEDGQQVPEPINKKRYSGKYALRMTPEQHKRVAIEAAEQGVSINQLLVSRI
ncbi:MAG: type II toxin-antitoxin system HicB family antitoxin [Eggerthellaceae bacterium]|nr:type II toxin-antitoxin system HicB family antitoxin [Eggerthellaceae bacterium]